MSDVVLVRLPNKGNLVRKVDTLGLGVLVVLPASWAWGWGISLVEAASFPWDALEAVWGRSTLEAGVPDLLPALGGAGPTLVRLFSVNELEDRLL